MMSSSDNIRRLNLIDLDQDLPSPSGPDFVEEMDFSNVESTQQPQLSTEEAYRNGLAEGEQRGREAALKELQPAIQELQKLALSLTQVRQQRLADAESELLQAATNIVRRILHGELQQENDIVVRMAHACISEAEDEGTLTLHVNPGDVELPHLAISSRCLLTSPNGSRTGPHRNSGGRIAGCRAGELPLRCGVRLTGRDSGVATGRLLGPGAASHDVSAEPMFYTGEAWNC